MKNNRFLITILFLASGVVPAGCDNSGSSGSENIVSTTMNITVTFDSIAPEEGDTLVTGLFTGKDGISSSFEPSSGAFKKLTADDIENGITLTLDKPAGPTLYVGIYIDRYWLVGGTEGLDRGEYAGFYGDKTMEEVLDWVMNDTPANAPANAASQSEITIALDRVHGVALTINFTGTTIPSTGDKLNCGAWFSADSLEAFLSSPTQPDAGYDVDLRQCHVTLGTVTIPLAADPAQQTLYVAAMVDADRNGPDPGDLVEIYQDLAMGDVSTWFATGGVLGSEPINASGQSALVMNLNTVLP